MINPDYVQQLVALAIAEDLGTGDITAQLVPEEKQTMGQIITREEAIICGSNFVQEVYRQIDPTVRISWTVKDGDEVVPNQVLCRLKGSARSLLSGERTALNFLQTLSGTATITRKYVNLLKGTHTQLLDTRKTIPGLRIAQKYAVRCGGGKNHRIGLFDAFLIKENHILSCGSIKQAIDGARKQHPTKTIEVEVENLVELEEALSCGADIIMLDNFTLEAMSKAVRLTAGRSKLEVSGNVNETQLLEIAATKVDYISVGAITKHVKAIDLSMRLLQ